MKKYLSQKKIREAIFFLMRNEIIILPTDTIYGLSAKYNIENQIRINKIKKSDEKKPLIILISNIKQAKSFVDLDKKFKSAIKSKHPTTIIYKKNNSSQTFALRLVQRKDLKKIIKKVGPIFSTSVNYSGENFIFDEKELLNFSNEISKVFYTKPLKMAPSKIKNLTNDKFER